MGRKKIKKTKKQSGFLSKLKLGLFLNEAFLFLLTQVIGILVGVKLLETVKAAEISLPETSIWQFLFYFLIATLSVLVFLKFVRKSRLPFQFFFAFALFVGTQTVMGTFLSNFNASLAAFFVVFLRFFHPRVFTHNFALVLAIAGIGVSIGLSVSPIGAVIILAGLSVYDIIAVYRTKHMVKMAKEMMAKGVVFAFIIPQRPFRFGAGLKNTRSAKDFMILGAGDIAFPLLLSVSSLSLSIYHAVIVAVFSLVGLFLTHFLFISQERRSPMPALPPIALSAILGFLIGWLIF